jgi:exopolysaccharide biosynthesis protein
VQVLRNGLSTAPQNAELHPRTAIGIDRDQRRLHLVVADGRSTISRGLTLVQLAALLRSLGDEDALNLDGGGSSTMIARDATGVVAVRNRPSDGQQRRVPNGLGFRYTPPLG